MLLLLFSVYFAGVTAFPHTHEIGSRQIVHSHPFSGSHTHSDHSISAIGQWGVFYSAPVSSFEPDGPECRVVEHVRNAGLQYAENPASSYKCLRAPPTVS